ncbi:coiled-coil-helix-coiled-coil-helix domain-containing protein 7 [Drosophila grimshawi]|uniref:Coiled-coil-helix-coiled-coil-helix domain-containing protein 7 n=1 Tax=Drosophila grimshawi TaxID=7222 RepID=B4J3N6_DROGR|nr:coiled-coil-helix-coiled-coil-helix domain-containing protein 7 [Drosophila grimshawi]EDV97267.1 GH14781 [Drosophila grimshawi]
MPRNPNAERDNPCLREQELSFNCLNKNNFDRDICEVYFANYNNCKEFWNKVRSDRRAKGIEPYLPPIEERAAIKADYMKTKPKSK